ncbi:hypothetical protein EVAR_83977_1 [Eumeta japonica]|uniref:Uncharacterized protein n=1 Tax=Eumeta variegata TaxID=151549 RepID=A0A4C1VPK0_EUMVA|nr:hypothetical protein EVAR_83977_1 [Eumeta japonica]
MWVGFNALIANDKNITQDIFYLTPINESPTKDYVVHETMMRSIKGAEECEQQYAQVHYDLAIASKSLKIQNSELRRNEDSTLKRIFVHLGLLHIAMSQFKVIGDIDLYKYTLPLIANLFFVFSHQNYARYLTLYHCNLENVEQSHPGLNVVVGIKRTNKPFCKREVDFTVESTINADAAKRSPGIACMKNSISARQRWSKSHAQRTGIISHVLAEVLMKKREEFTNDLRKSKIEKSHLRIQQFEDRPQTKCPENFIADLKTIKFKQAFVQYVVNDWSTQDKAMFIKPTHKVFLNYQLCHSYRKLAESVAREVSEKYTCSAHEEADTKIVYHVCVVGSCTNILIKCSDTDILVILLANMKQILVNVGENQFNVDRKIWMQLGTGNHVKNIDVCAVYRDMAENLCSSLAVLHAFTGSDFNPAFYRKGKNRPFKVLEKSGKFQDAFIKMGHNTFVADPLVMEQAFNVLQEYVCVLFNVKARKTVNEARCIIFERIYTPKNSSEAFKKTTMKLEATSFPPCFRELKQHMKRSTYIAQIWCNAYKQIPSTLFPISYGWIVNDGRYDFDWFHGEECPQKVCDITEPDEESGEEDDDVIENDREDNSDVDEDVDSDNNSAADSDTE